jgi:hypothetical protein
MYVLIL